VRALSRGRDLLLIFAAPARLCFFRLVADVSLARGHSPHTADMGKGPVFYSEIGKKARGLLSLFFSPFDQSFWSSMLVGASCLLFVFVV
jgi:hypothetical protein